MASAAEKTYEQNTNALDKREADIRQQFEAKSKPFEQQIQEGFKQEQALNTQEQALGADYAKASEDTAKWAGENVPKKFDYADFKPQPINREDMNAIGAIMMGFALLGSRNSSAPMVVAGNALAGALQGYKEGNAAKFEQDYKTYKQNFDKALRTHEDEMTQYKEILNAKNMDLSAKMRRIELLAKGHNNIKVATAAATHNLQLLDKEMQGQLKMVDNARNRSEKHVEFMQREADRVEQMRIQQEHFHEMEGLQRERNQEMSEWHKTQAEMKAGGGGGLQGGLAGMAGNRLVNSANEAAVALRTTANLPVTTTSPVFGQKEYEGSLFKAPLSALNQKMSDETSQMMVTRLAGVSRNLASLETGGAATGLVGLSDKLERAISIPAGAKLSVAIDKFAEMRQIFDASVDASMAQKNINPDQKKLLKEAQENVHKAIPFTHDDVDEMMKSKNSKQSFSDYMKSKKGIDVESDGSPEQSPGTADDYLKSIGY